MSTHAVNFKFNVIGGNVGKMFASIERLNGKAQRDINNTSRATGTFLTRLTKVERKLLNLPTRGLRRVGSILRSMIPIGSVVSIASIGMGLRGVVSTLAEMERYEAVLGNTLGSKSLARKSLMEISKFASETPFQVNNLTDSFVRLSNQGFVPSMDDMRKLGDLSSSTGKDITQLVEAVLDAQVGEMERLKEFGIRAQKDGDRIRFTFKNITTEVDNNASSIRGYLLSLGEMKGVAGAMDSISKTSGGMLSNLADKWMMFKWQLGEANKWLLELAVGGMNKLIDKMQGLVKWTEDNKAMLQSFVINGLSKVSAVASIAWGILTGLFQLIRKSIGWIKDNKDEIKKWVDFLAKAAFWAGVLRFSMLAYGGVTAIITAVTTGIYALRSGLIAAQVAQWLLNIAMNANPIGIIITAVGIVLPLLLILATRFDWVKERLKDIAKWILKITTKYFPSLLPAVTSVFSWLKKQFKSFSDWIDNLINYLPSWVKKLFGLEAINMPKPKKDEDGDGNGNGDGGGDGDDNEFFSPGGEGGQSVSERLAGVTASGRESIKNININIENLVRELMVKTETMNMAESQIKALIAKTLITAVNDVNYGG